MPDAALVEAIRAVLAASPFHGEGHRKVWARLRVGGVRTSKRRVLRLMREHGLLAPSRVGAPRGPRNHDGTIIPDTVDTMWGTDLTTTDHRRGPGRGVRRRRPLLGRVRRHPRRAPGHPLRGARADPPGRAALLRRVRQGHRARPRRPARSRDPVHVRRLPEGARLPRHRELARLRARARGQRLRRALHPHPEGEPALGADLRHRRGAPPGAARLPRDLQHDLAHRAARVQATRRRPRTTSFHPRPWPRRLQSGVSPTAGGTGARFRQAPPRSTERLTAAKISAVDQPIISEPQAASSAPKMR